MKVAKLIERYNKTKNSNKILAILIVLAVVGIGIDLIVTHAASNFVQTNAYSGSVTNATKVADGSAIGGGYVQFNGPTTGSTCPSGVNVPTGDQVGWKNVFSFSFCKVPDVPLGAFSGCSGSSLNCTGLAPYNNSTYNYLQNNWGDDPDGWPSTAYENFKTPNSGCIYAPSDTLSVTGGVLDMNIHTGPYNGPTGAETYINYTDPCMTAAPWPKISDADAQGGQLYGKYEVMVRIDTDQSDPNDCYKTAFLLWPDDENWPKNGELDFPEGDLGPCSGQSSQYNNSIIGANTHYENGSDTNADNYNTSDSYGAFNDQWHMYTTIWQPGLMTYQIDGQTVHTVSATCGNVTLCVPDTSMHWILQTESALCGGICLPSTTESGHLDIAWAAAWEYDPTCEAVPCP